MEWPSTVPDRDAIIVHEETMDGLRFVVHSRRGPQFLCPTYAEAEARAFSYAEHACVRVWYADVRGLQLVGSFARMVVSSPAIAETAVTQTPNP